MAASWLTPTNRWRGHEGQLRVDLSRSTDADGMTASGTVERIYRPHVRLREATYNA
jgi:hypothetical protein